MSYLLRQMLTAKNKSDLNGQVIQFVNMDDHLSVNTGAVGSNPDSAMLYSGIGSDEM